MRQTDAAARGIPTVPKHSLRGLWRTARARVVVVTHGFGDVNRYAVSGAFVVQLWHGIPLKRIGLDSPETLRLPGVARARAARRRRRAARCSARMYRGAARRIRVLPAASHLVRGRLESAFALADERVPVTGEPRVDVLSQGTPDERRAAARAAIERRRRADRRRRAPRALRADVARRRRRSRRARRATTGARSSTCSRRTTPCCSSARIRSARATTRRRSPTERVRRLGSDLVPDVTPLLPGFDALVTDYSSLAFDAALVPLPVVFLAPDLEEYAAARGFYGTYADVAGDDWAVDWTGAAAQLDARARRRRRARARASSGRARSSARVHAFRDGEQHPQGVPCDSGGTRCATPAARKDLDDRRPLHDRRRSGADPLRRRAAPGIRRTRRSARARRRRR